MNVVDTIKNAAFASAIQAALKYMDKDPETNIPKVMTRLLQKAGMQVSVMRSARESPKRETGMNLPQKYGHWIRKYEKLSLQTLSLTLL